MKLASKITLGILTVAALFGAAVLIERQFPDGIFARFGVTKKARFRATTRFQINQAQVPDVFGSTTSKPIDIPSTWLDSQLHMLTSRDTLLIAVRNLNLEKNWHMPAVQASDRLERMIDVEQERGTAIITLTAWSENVLEAAALANGVRDAYAERRTQMEEERLRRLSEDSAIQITQQEAVVEKARLDMLELIKKDGIVDAVAERQKESEYAIAKARYESQLQLLNIMKEHEMRRRVDEGVMKRPIEVLETAKPPINPASPADRWGAAGWVRK